MLTIDTAAALPAVAAALGVVHRAGWKHRSNCPCASAGRSTLSSYILALVPAIHHAIHRPRILNAQLARHGRPLAARPGSVNSEDLHDTCTFSQNCRASLGVPPHH